jgi:hypothetical protein
MLAERTSFMRTLLPADQTQQIKLSPGNSPPAKLLREIS